MTKNKRSFTCVNNVRVKCQRIRTYPEAIEIISSTILLVLKKFDVFFLPKGNIRILFIWYANANSFTANSLNHKISVRLFDLPEK